MLMRAPIMMKVHRILVRRAYISTSAAAAQCTRSRAATLGRRGYPPGEALAHGRHKTPANPDKLSEPGVPLVLTLSTCAILSLTQMQDDDPICLD